MSAERARDRISSLNLISGGRGSMSQLILGGGAGPIGIAPPPAKPCRRRDFPRCCIRLHLTDASVGLLSSERETCEDVWCSKASGSKGKNRTILFDEKRQRVQ